MQNPQCQSLYIVKHCFCAWQQLMVQIQYVVNVGKQFLSYLLTFISEVNHLFNRDIPYVATISYGISINIGFEIRGTGRYRYW